MAENAPPSTANNTSNTSGDGSTRGMPYYEKLRSNLRETLAKKRALDAKVAQLDDLILAHETAYLEETSAAGNVIRGFDNYIKAASTTAATTSTITPSSASAIGGSGAQGLGSLGAGTSTRRRTQISDADRIFSRSSAAFTNADPSAASPPGSSGGLEGGNGAGGGGGGAGRAGSGEGLGGDGGGGGGGGGGSATGTGSAGVGTPRSGGHAATPSASSFAGAANRDTPKSEVGKAGAGNRSKDKKKGAVASAAAAAAAAEKSGEKDEDEEGRPAKRGKISYGRD